MAKSCGEGSIRRSKLVQPTGSGKSLCFQLPPYVTGKMTAVISPTISLMADQCASLTDKGISATFLGSAQSDKTRPSQVLQGKFRIVYITPESFFASQGKPSKLFEELLQKPRVGLIAVDEAHLVLSWQSFR